MCECWHIIFQALLLFFGSYFSTFLEDVLSQNKKLIFIKPRIYCHLKLISLTLALLGHTSMGIESPPLHKACFYAPAGLSSSHVPRSHRGLAHQDTRAF